MHFTAKLLMILAVSGAAWTQVPDRNEMALQAAMKKETVDGDLKGAVEAYKKLAQGRDHGIAARALVRMGECYEKLGDAEARKAYERVVREFGDQKESVDAARVRLAAMGTLGGSGLRSITNKFQGASPDGRLLLVRGDKGALDLQDVKTGVVRHLTKGTQAWGPVFTHDGTQVAFVRWANDACELWTVSTVGTAERLLYHPEKDWCVEDTIGWSADGKRIMARVQKGKEKGRLIAVSVADGVVSTIWEGKPLGFTDLSADGKTAVVSKRVRENPVADELWLIGIEDRKEMLLFEGHSAVFYPVWTPDGDGIAFLSDRRAPGSTADLWLLRVSGGRPLGFPELVKMGLGDMNKGYPTISPIGPMYQNGAYHFLRHLGRNDMRQLLMADFDPDTGRVVGASSFVSRQGGESWSPSFSHDGRWLAYLRENTGSSSASLLVRSIHTGEESVIPLTPSLERLNWVVMFPDGQH